jgi:hypothetical protein
LNSSNSIAFSADLGNLNIVFFATFNWLWTAEAAASKTSSSVRHSPWEWTAWQLNRDDVIILQIVTGHFFVNSSY